ncbi:hypothetical protein PIB30_068827, partial [Stylosanthes scabra]|nr:hypothetical protein [Stylosanthes scabra]
MSMLLSSIFLQEYICSHHQRLTGTLLTASSSLGICISPLAAEAQAMREALITAANLQIDKPIFESDSVNLIQAIKTKSSIAEIDAILEDIWEISKRIPGSGFTWVTRECNKVTHEAAKMMAIGALTPSWSSNPPFSLRSLIHFEALNQSRLNQSKMKAGVGYLSSTSERLDLAERTYSLLLYFQLSCNGSHFQGTAT